jgi:hypothetical protein
LDSLKNEKQSIEREIQYREDMVNNLSLELARTKNDKKFMGERADKLEKDNISLRQELKQLVVSKGALEKSIIRLSQEKDQIEGKLGQSESIIQSKIDEIWQIKGDIDKTVDAAKIVNPTGSQMELSPIVVTSDGQAGTMAVPPSSQGPGFHGRVVSLNEDNNFVIIDLGESAGLKLGDVLGVYHDSKYIARLEVIQVRKDISAADIKEQWTKVRVGDTIK